MNIKPNLHIDCKGYVRCTWWKPEGNGMVSRHTLSGCFQNTSYDLYDIPNLPFRVPARICWLVRAGKHLVCLSSVWRPKMRTVA